MSPNVARVERSQILRHRHEEPVVNIGMELLPSPTMFRSNDASAGIPMAEKPYNMHGTERLDKHAARAA